MSAKSKVISGYRYHNRFSYKGLYGTIEPNQTEDCLQGRIQAIPRLILYKGQTMAELRVNFYAAVDNYFEILKGEKV